MARKLQFQFEQLRYIKTRARDDKRPQEKWGGYNQDFDETGRVYTHEEVITSSHDFWAIVGVDDIDHGSLSLLVFDLDVHKAPEDFDPSRLSVPNDTALVKSQSGGYHVYFIVHGERGSLSESDFHMTQDLGWGIDIRGSAVTHHVVAPQEIPGVDTPYEIVNDKSIKTIFDPADAADRIRCDGEPLLEYDPATSHADAVDIDRDIEAPEKMPTCYHRGLQLREASPDNHPSTHQVNVLTALCGLYAGYDVETVIDHFLEYAPDSPSREETEYQVNHIAERIDAGNYSPPAIATLRDFGILADHESCTCDIEYHGGSDNDTTLPPAEMWRWWSNARTDGKLDETSVIPEDALWHIAREHGSYDLDALPDDVDSLPAKAHNRALYWVENIWPDQDDCYLSLRDDEDVTARPYRARDPDGVYTWEDVRYIYDESKQDGRYAAVSLLREKYEFLTPEDTENLHVYDEDLGIFDKTAKFVIGRTLDRELGTYYTQHEKTEILGRLKERKVEREQLEAGDYAGNYVCVKNGVLDLDERELLDHDPDFKFTTRLPQRYDPDAECTRIRKFLDEITRREEDAQTMLEMLGNTLLANYDYESFMVLFGEGSNGKSMFFEMAREFIGNENVESMTLQQITDNRFAASNLVGQWANIGEDLPAKKIHDLGTLKDLTGGGETTVEPKGKDHFSFRNRAKMMFAANDPPVLGERTKAVARRILPIRLPYQFTNDPNDGHKDAQKEGLLEELTTDKELSGLLNEALDGLERLREQGDFSLPENHQERLEYYEQNSDHIKAYAVNCLENQSGHRINKSDVYNAYTNYCAEEGHEPVAKSTFWTQLRKTTLNVTEVRPETVNGDRPRMMDNTAFTGYGTEFAPNYEVESEADTISSLAPDDRNVTVEARVEDRDTDTPDEVAEKVTLVDTSGTITGTIWANAGVPALVEGECYRIKNATVDTYDGSRELYVNENTGVEEIGDGVGNAPSADPGDNAQLGTAADGGETMSDNDSDGITQLDPEAIHYVREKGKDYPEGVPHDMLFGHLVGEGASPEKANSVIDKLLHKKGELHEPRTDHYRVT